MSRSSSKLTMSQPVQPTMANSRISTKSTFPRMCFHLERNYFWSQSTERGLDNRRSRRTDDLRRHLSGIRDGSALEQAGCRYLVLAESDGRGSGPWHDRSQSESSGKNESYPSLAASENFSSSEGGNLIKGIFEGATINTVSMICVEDALDDFFGRKVLAGWIRLSIDPTKLKCVENWVRDRDWVDFLASDPPNDPTLRFACESPILGINRYPAKSSKRRPSNWWP